MHWSEVPIHFVDFEGSVASGVIEYGVITLLGGEIVAARTRICAPPGELKAIDIGIHGLDLSAVGDALPMREDWEIFAGLREKGPFAAHFAGTENAMLKAVWPYARVSPDFARPGQTTAEWGPWIDTGHLVRQLFRGVISARLEDLVDQFRVRARLEDEADRWCPPDRRFFHAALYDALAGALVLHGMLDQPHFGGVTIPWIIQQSAMAPLRREMLQQGQLF